MTEIKYQSVADGRAQADRLRPLNIVRRPASPRVVCPDPSAEQMAVLEKERARYGDGKDVIKGVIYPSGLMLLEFRIYKSSKPWLRQAVRRDGKVTYSAQRDTYGYRRAWTVTRGKRGRKPVGKGNMSEYESLLVITGRIKPDEARGWDI